LNLLLESYDVSKEAGDFPGWKSLSPRKTNSWLDLFARAWREDRDLPLIARRYVNVHESMDRRLGEKVLRNVEEYPHSIVISAYSALQGEYRPMPLQEVAAAGKWTYD
jgi:hypothetical protein